MLRWLALLVVSALAAGVAIVAARGRTPTPARRVVVAVSPQMLSAAIYHARDHGLFAREGLAVELLEFEVGRDALEAVLADRAQVGTAAETPITHAVIAGRPVAVLATIGEASGAIAVIGRRSRGIARVGDLAGRRVALTPGTNVAYYLHNLLRISGVAEETVTVVPCEPQGLAALLAAGEVDAVGAWDRLIPELTATLGADAAVFSPDELYRFTWNLVAERGWAEREPEVAARFLTAVVRASVVLEREPEALRRHAIQVLGLPAPPEPVDRYHYRITLDQTLLLMMEQQARWALRTQRDQPLPNLLDALDPRPLRRVAPDAVTLITAR